MTNSPAPESARPKAFDCVIATTPQDLDQVYRLRYKCYRRKNSIDAERAEHFSDDFDRMANSFSFLVRSHDEPLATVRITVVKAKEGWRDSPVQHVYGDLQELQIMAQDSFVEASRLCFVEQARRSAFVGLVAHMAALADLHETKWLVACPREEHSAIYQRMFGFRPLAPARQYFGVKFKTQLLAIRREELHDYVRRSQPMTQACQEALTKLRSATLNNRPSTARSCTPRPNRAN